MAKLITLNKKRDFDNARYNGLRFFCKLFFISKVARKSGAEVNDINGPRFGFIISKKVSKSAVKRNKIRRRLKEIIRAHAADFLDGHDYVLVAKSAIVDAEFAQIEKQIEKAVKFFSKRSSEDAMVEEKQGDNNQ